MSDERIDIELKDSVAPSIAPKIREIAAASKEAHTAVLELKQRLATLKDSALSTLKQQISGLNSALKANAGANAQLANAQQKAAVNALKLQIQQAKLNIAQTQGATAAQRLATAQNQTAASASRAAAAQLRLQQAQQKATKSSNEAAAGAGLFLKRALGFIGLGLSAGAVLKLSDSYTILQNKLTVVAESEEGLATLTDRVFQVANRTRTNVEDTAKAYSRFDLALKQVGGSQEESLRLTETINKMLIVSGASTEEASSALLQLSQGFNKGVLNGDEFRSVMELMPLAADAIAKKLGVTRGELLKLAPQGKITAQVMRQAFADVAGDVDKKFGKTIPTIGQSLTVLKNKFTQTFGEINKNLGISSAVSKFVKLLGDNIKPILGILATLAVALLVVFGPSLVGMLGTATGAVWAFTAALLANPIGLIAVGITAAVAGIAIFGDKIKVTSDGLVTLKDVALAVWAYIKDGFKLFSDWIKTAWNAATEFMSGKTSGWGDSVRKVLMNVLNVAKTVVNSYIGFWIGGFNAIINNWQLLPAALKDIFAEGINALIEIGKKVGLDKIIGLDKFKMKVTGAAQDLGANVRDSFKAAFSVDYVGNAADALISRARKIAEERKRTEAAKGKGLRGAGPYTPPPDEEAIKEAARRKSELDKLNRSLDEELTILQRKQPLDYIENRMLQITNDLLDKKIKLTDKEKEGLRSKIELIQKERTANAASKIAAELQTELKGLRANRVERYETAKLAEIENKLKEDQIVLTDEQKTVVKGLLSVIQKQKTANALQEINKELDQQSTLLSIIGPQREIEQEMQQIENDLRQKGLALSVEENAKLRERFKLQQEQQRVSQILNSIYDETKGQQIALGDAITATNEALKAKIITIDQYNQRMVQLGIQGANLRLQLGQGNFEDVALGGVGKLLDGYTNVLDGLSNSFGEFFTQLNDGFANSIGRAIVYSDNLGESLMKVGQEAMASLISGLVKLGIQWLITKAIGAAISKSIMASEMAASAAMATATAAAWAPAAAMVSLATFGANSAGAMAGIGATTALSQALALTSLAGFEKGGLIPGGEQIIRVNEGGNEFVMNAAATRANRPALEAMNNGQIVGGNVNIYVEHDGSTGVSVQQIDENSYRIIARQEARSVLNSEGPSVIANHINEPNSRVSKAIGRNIEAKRRR